MSFLTSFYNVGIVLIGVSLLGATAGAIGCFAVLRRRALTGDALAHAALPGVCIAFLVVGERSLPILLLGALGSGLLGIAVINALRRWTRVKEDAAIGSVLSVFFGVGVVFMSIIPRLPGGGRAGLDSFILGKTAGMIQQDVELISVLAVVTLVLLGLLFKEFKLLAFDPGFTQVQGYPVFLLDFLLMAMIVLAVVIGLPAVGVLMMAALLVIPAATARFWTDNLGVLLGLASGFGAVSGILGTLVSASFERIPAGPAIILTCALFFAVSLIVSPRRGLAARLLRQLHNERDLQRRQFLAALYDFAEPTLPLLAAFPVNQLLDLHAWTPRQLRRRLREGVASRDIRLEGDTVALTPQGLESAAAAARTQRLWKLFLVEHPDLAPGLLTMNLPPLESVLHANMVQDLQDKLRAQGGMPRAGGMA